MFKLLFAAVVVIILISAFIIIVRNKPDLWFWIFLNLYFDPGGYVYDFMGGTLLGPLHITDVFISGIVLCMIFAKINWAVIFQDKFLRNFLFFLVIFGLYYFIAYGGIIPYLHDDFDYPTFLMKNRLFLYGFIILFSVYAFSLRSLYYFYTTTLFVGAICLTLFFITLLTGIPLIPVWEFARNPGDEMMRISMMGYGLFYLLFPLSLITYLVSRKISIKINYQSWLYYCGTIMIITLLITLTRRIQIDIIGSVLIAVLIISYVFRTGKLSSLLKVILPAFLIVLVMYFAFPKYIGDLAEIGEDTFLLMTTGKDSKGETDQRVTGTDDYELVKEYIGNNIFFGAGYTHLYWQDGRATSIRGKEFAEARDAAGEVPIYQLFFDFGLAGAILMLPLYFMLGKLSLKLMKLLRQTTSYLLRDPLALIFSVYIILTITKKFTLNFYALSQDFSAPLIGYVTILIGVGLALYHKISLSYSE